LYGGCAGWEEIGRGGGFIMDRAGALLPEVEDVVAVGVDSSATVEMAVDMLWLVFGVAILVKEGDRILSVSFFKLLLARVVVFR
jgi:hypothetical protein